MTKEMELFRKMLDDNGIEWHDASDMGAYPITRTHFNYRGHDWSVIHGYGSYGGYSSFEKDKGLLELMSNAVNYGEPVGFLTAKEAFDYVRGDTEFYDEDDYWNGRVPTHGRLIDADALIEDFNKLNEWLDIDEEAGIVSLINNAPTVSVADITQRDLCKDISCTDCPFMKETCRLMDYVAYADRPHGEWIFEETDEYKRTYCSVCGVSAPFICVSDDYYGRRVHGETRKTNFCPNCGAMMSKGGGKE